MTVQASETEQQMLPETWALPEGTLHPAADGSDLFKFKVPSCVRLQLGNYRLVLRVHHDRLAPDAAVRSLQHAAPALKLSAKVLRWQAYLHRRACCDPLFLLLSCWPAHAFALLLTAAAAAA